MPLQQYDTIELRDEFEGTLGDHEAIDRHPNRTSGKDEVAEYIRDEVVAKGRWGTVQMTDLADETGWSRQHVSNTISHYFVGVDDEINQQADPTNHSSPMSASPGGPNTTSQTDGQTSGSSGQTGTTETKTVFVKTNDHVEEVEMQIPADVERSSYIRGFLDRAQQE